MPFHFLKLRFAAVLAALALSMGPVPAQNRAAAEKPSKAESRTALSKPDKHALSLSGRYTSISALAADLSKPFTDDEDKVRAFYMWITANISYDCKLYHEGPVSVRFTGRNEKELAEKQQQFYLEYATRALRNRQAICEGYTTLFRELCRAQNIPCEVVVGRVAKDVKLISRLRGKNNFDTNHVWNKVTINGEEFYLDATWASGYCDRGVRKFYRDRNDHYYLTGINDLYDTHAVNKAETASRNRVQD
jgi:transglutaminase/protease-like cytokinesis protein 3